MVDRGDAGEAQGLPGTRAGGCRVVFRDWCRRAGSVTGALSVRPRNPQDVVITEELRMDSPLAGRAMAIADRHAGGRVVSLLEGGYNLQGLASAAAAHVGELLGPPA